MLIAVAFTVQLLRGTDKVPSVIGISNCSPTDNLILGSFVGFAVSLIIFEIRRVRSEQTVRTSLGKPLPEGEVELTGVKLPKLIIGSVVGGIVGAMGLGGGVVFNPVLLSLGVPPTVVAATSMLLIMYS